MDFELVTNRPYSPSSEVWVAAKKGLENHIRRSSKSKVADVGGIASIFRKLVRTEVNEADLREEIRKTGEGFGMLDSEIKAGVDELVGLVTRRAGDLGTRIVRREEIHKAFVGHDDPYPNVLALVGRIRESNNRASTDTELFHVLAAIAPLQVLTLANAFNWPDWLVEARTALCEAIRTVAANHEAHRDSASNAFWLSCETRHSKCDVPLVALSPLGEAIASNRYARLGASQPTWNSEKRAAEAVAWLPIADYPDEAVSRFGFGGDPEPSVREIWKGGETWKGVLSARTGTPVGRGIR